MKKIFIILLLFIIVGCSGKEKIATDINNFNYIMLNNNFTIVDNSYKYADKDFITSSSLAKKDDIEIEMVTYINSEEADKVHKNHIENFNYSKSTAAPVVRDKGKNYYHYALISNNMYMISVRVDNTLIFTKSNIKNKELIEKIYNELNY